MEVTVSWDYSINHLVEAFIGGCEAIWSKWPDFQNGPVKGEHMREFSLSDDLQQQ